MGNGCGMNENMNKDVNRKKGESQNIDKNKKDKMKQDRNVDQTGSAGNV